MKKIIIIGANEFQNQLILKAKNMGYETHVFAWKDGAIGEKSADYFYPISITEKEQILEKCREIQPHAVLSIASDLAVITVNYIAEKLGLPCNGIETTDFTTNKYAMRKQLEKFNLPIPHYSSISTYEEAVTLNMTYPLIVKPTDRSGSRGVTKIDDECELKAAIRYASLYSFEKKAIIEEYLTGDEYSCECISFQGVHHLLAITKKYTTNAPYFIETAHLQPSDLDQRSCNYIEKIVYKALDALLIKNGASHTEIKLTDTGDIGIIEIGARMGGDCIGSDLVLLSTGYDYLKMVIQVASGEAPSLIKSENKKYAGIKFLFNEMDLKKMKKLEKELPQCFVRIHIEENLEQKVVDSSSRLGYYLFSSANRSDVMRVLDYE